MTSLLGFILVCLLLAGLFGPVHDWLYYRRKK